jgi:hypothetical protein
VVIWKDIRGYTGLYKVSNTGKIKNVKRNTLLKPAITKKGYCIVALSKHNKATTKNLHRLVAKAFIANPKRKKEVNHKDGNKLNNNDWNLEWNTSSENHLHAFSIGLKNQKGENNNYKRYLNKKHV